MRLRVGEVRINQLNFAGVGAVEGNHDELLGGGLVYAEMICVILLFIDQLVVELRRTQFVSPHLIRKQRLRVFSHIVEGARVITPREAGRGVAQHFRVPAATLQVTEADAILPARQEIFSQRHDPVIRTDMQRAHGIEITMRGALVGIQQQAPLARLIARGRLAIIGRVFVTALVTALITVAIFHIGH